MKPAPYQIQTRGLIETLLMRLGLAAVVIWTLPNATQVTELTSQKNPTGLTHFFDLTFLAEPAIYTVLYSITVVALRLYVLGIAVPLTIGFTTLFHIAVFSLVNSQGAQRHTFNIVSLVLLAQCIVYLVAFFRRKKPFKHRVSDLAIHFSLHAIAAAYVIAGVIKILRSKGMWAWQSPDIAVELMKTNAQRYYEYLEQGAGFEQRLTIATWMIENPWLTRILLGGGLFIELFAFLLLRNRLWAGICGVFLLALHGGIEITMGLSFKYNSAIILIFLINVPFWLMWLGGKVSKRNGSLDLTRNADFPWKKTS